MPPAASSGRVPADGEVAVSPTELDDDDWSTLHNARRSAFASDGSTVTYRTVWWDGVLHRPRRLHPDVSVVECGTCHRIIGFVTVGEPTTVSHDCKGALDADLPGRRER